MFVPILMRIYPLFNLLITFPCEYLLFAVIGETKRGRDVCCRIVF